MAAASSSDGIPCLTREELLAANLPYEVRGTSVTPSGKMSPVVYRYSCEESALTHLAVERRILSTF